MTAPRLLAPLTLALSLAGLAGCSMDKHLFESTMSSPKTVAIVDTVSGDALWSMDVPVGQRLVLDLDSVRETSVVPAEPPIFTYDDKSAVRGKWKLLPLESRFFGQPLEKGEIELPGRPVRLEMIVRDPQFEPTGG